MSPMSRVRASTSMLSSAKTAVARRATSDAWSSAAITPLAASSTTAASSSFSARLSPARWMSRTTSPRITIGTTATARTASVHFARKDHPNVQREPNRGSVYTRSRQTALNDGPLTARALARTLLALGSSSAACSSRAPRRRRAIRVTPPIDRRQPRHSAWRGCP